MADSDDSTTLSSVIKRWRRRHALVDVLARGQDAAIEMTSAMMSADPAAKLFEDWQETHHAATVLCRLQQRQERRILWDDANHNAGERRRAQRGHEAARIAELAAMDAEEHLLTKLASTPANSLPGVLAKLEMIASAGKGRGGMKEFPWPQIHSTAEDLRDVLAGREEAAASV